MTPPRFSWMIEIGTPGGQQYYTGIENIWDVDANEGLQFARRHDAEKFRLAFFKELPARSREHGWT